MPTAILDQRRRAFEEEFFAKQNQQLLAKVRETLEVEHPREVLRATTGIHDDAILDTLVSLHVNHDTLAAFALYPLVEVAWADGAVDEKEREAFMKAAAEHGIHVGTPGHDALRRFLKETPREEARKAWFVWAGALNDRLEPWERKKLRETLVARARAVAEASGGFLGLTSHISEGEQRVLDRIAEVFADRPALDASASQPR